MGGITPPIIWEVSSAVEHLVYTERVGGSKPSLPTITVSWLRGRKQSFAK